MAVNKIVLLYYLSIKISIGGANSRRQNKTILIYVFEFLYYRYFINSSTSEKFRMHREKMARRMQQYLEARECRRQLLLSYFGEPKTGTESKEPNPNCCDICNKW